MRVTPKILLITYLVLMLPACNKSKPAALVGGGVATPDPVSQTPVTKKGNPAPTGHEFLRMAGKDFLLIDENGHLSTDAFENLLKQEPELLDFAYDAARLTQMDINRTIPVDHTASGDFGADRSDEIFPNSEKTLKIKEENGFIFENVKLGMIDIRPTTIDSTAALLIKDSTGNAKGFLFKHIKRVENVLIGYLPASTIATVRDLDSEIIPVVIGKSPAGLALAKVQVVTSLESRKNDKKRLVAIEIEAESDIDGLTGVASAEMLLERI